MKLKTALLFDMNFIESLIYFGKLDDLPVKISFPLKKCLLVFQNEEKTAKAQRDELIKKYGQQTTDENGNPSGWDISKASKENQEGFIKEINDLFNFDFEIPLEEKLSVSLKDIENVKISSEKLIAMETLINFN